jgi:hypothetical protein
MFLKAHTRAKDGKRHRYYSLVESVHAARGIGRLRIWAS